MQIGYHDNIFISCVLVRNRFPNKIQVKLVYNNPLQTQKTQFRGLLAAGKY